MKAIEELRGYLDVLAQARERVQELEENAATVQGQAEAYEAVQVRRRAAESDRAAFEKEREQLRSEWLEASWNEDAAAQRDIRNRRVKLDQQIADLAADDGDDPDGPDARELAALTLRWEQALTPPSCEAVVAEIAALLEGEREDIRARVQAVKLPTGHDQAHYRELKEKADPVYASHMARERHLRKKDQERREKLARYGDPSSTDELHAAMGSPRSLSGANVTVMESGREMAGRLDD